MAITTVGRTTIQGVTTVGGFNPATLFAAGEQGVWFDPSDFSTLFQDSAGTTPVTALEQPVGRILDKSGRGNHATQSTNTSFRPVVSARVNLLTYTEQFDNAAWSTSGLNAVSANSTIAPNGTATADTITASATNTIHDIYNTTGISFTSGVSYTHAVYLKKNTNDFAQLSLGSAAFGLNAWADFDLVNGVLGTVGSAATATITSVGSGWYRCTITAAATSTASSFYVVDIANSASMARQATWNAAGTESLYIWGADLRPTNQGVGLPVYQRVGAAVAGTSTTAGNADYDANGFPVYLKFDGSNDYMDFPALAISNQTILFGVQPASAVTAASSSQALLCTTSGDVSVISFGSTTATISNERISWLRVSTAVYGSGQTSEDFAASPYVLTFTYATTPSTAYNRNAVSKTLTNTNAAQPNGGAFTATIYPTNYARIGAREDATLPFNGNLYGLIVRGASSTANQITGAENWLNQKTAAY